MSSLQPDSVVLALLDVLHRRRLGDKGSASSGHCGPLNRPGFVGDSTLWKRGWSYGQKRENRAAVYSAEDKGAAVRMVRTLGAAQRVALQLGYGVGSVRSWVKQADIDDGVNQGVPSDSAAE